MRKENRKYECRCCGYVFTKEEGLEQSKRVGEATTYTVNGQTRTRRIILCPMCSAPKRYCDTFLYSA